MMTVGKTHLVFDSTIGGTKPVTIINNNVECPFCCREKLEGIIAEDGPIMLLNNKYPVLRDTVQTVLIETYECTSELSLYPKEHLYKVISVGVGKWLEMMDSKQFASVLFYKNHGPCSGGTIRHPHMQIVGLKYIDYSSNIVPEILQGDIIFQDTGVELNLSRQPKIGFFEFNITLHDLKYINRLADYIQMVTHYILNYFNKNCTSYNLFFYRFNGVIIVKIMPRFVTSPLFIGYSIPQVSSRMDEVIKEMQVLYQYK
jgi:ATP adenylyltransferase/5',5'''-P-1,P-4-tetraphosphate phosphorylase II